VHDTSGWVDVLGLKKLPDSFYKQNGQLRRYEGTKPTYQVNDKHVKIRQGSNATPLPNDAHQVFSRAVPDDPFNPRNWYGVNSSGEIYRFSSSNDGNVHFSGRENYGDGIRNLTDYAKERLNNQKSLCG
jgi:hypothetical protein